MTKLQHKVMDYRIAGEMLSSGGIQNWRSGYLKAIPSKVTSMTNTVPL